MIRNQITKSIIINGDAPSLYEAWLDYQNHPQFMKHIAEVSPEGQDRHRWVMVGPLDTRLEWMTKTTRLEPNKRIAWKTLEGDLKMSGQVTFNQLPRGQVEVTVTSQTVPPDDLIEMVSIELFKNEDAQLEKDLRSFKALVEKRSS